MFMDDEKVLRRRQDDGVLSHERRTAKDRGVYRLFLCAACISAEGRRPGLVYIRLDCNVQATIQFNFLPRAVTCSLRITKVDSGGRVL